MMWEASECAPTHGNYTSVMVCVTILGTQFSSILILGRIINNVGSSAL